MTVLTWASFVVSDVVVRVLLDQCGVGGAMAASEGRRVRSGSWGDAPAGGCGVQSECGEAGEVGGGGEDVEVGVDSGSSSDAGSASAVSSAHEVTELAFDLGTVGPVVGLPGRVALTGPGSGKGGFVDTDADRAPAGRVGALAAAWAARAVVSEVGQPTAVGAAFDLDGDAVGAGDGVGFEIDPEAALGEAAACGHRGRLGAAERRDVLVVEVSLELPGPIRPL